MKRLLFLLLLSGALACAGDLSSAKTVYVLSMPRGMDQFLANRLTNSHILQVVTDPKRADVFLSDRVGDALQAQLDAIFPPPEPPKSEKADKDDKTADKDAIQASSPGSMFGPTVNKLSNPSLSSSFTRNKGTIFLVDAQSREVLWSVYDPPKGSNNKELDHTANDIVSRLKKDLKK